MGPAHVSIITSASTLAVAWMATFLATMPPSEWPSRRKFSRPGRVGDRERVGDEPLQRVRGRVGRVVARAVPTMIEGHDRVIARQRRNVIGEVLLGAAQPVQQQEAGSLAGDFDLEPHPVVHRDPHPSMLTRNGRRRQTGYPGSAFLRT